MSSGRIDAPALSFLFSFFTSETSEADSTSEYYACYGSSYLVGVCVCVCACACVVYTRTRYTSVCARGINLRAFHDNCAGSYCCRLEAVSSVVAPTLLLFGWCSSFCSQRRARTTFRHGTLFGFRGRFLPKE